MVDLPLDEKLQGFQLLAQEKLQAVICSIPTSKDFIIEPQLIRPLQRVCSASWLKLKGIQHIYKFNPDEVNYRQDNIQLYLIRSNLNIFYKLLKQIHLQEKKKPSAHDSGVANFHVIFVPNCYMYFRSLLEEEGLYGIVNLHRFNWDFIHIDTNVFSMELPQVFETVFVWQETSILPSIAQTLRIVQMICGKPDIILTFGEHSKNIVGMIDILGPWPETPNITESTAHCPAMIIIDRDKDYPSCLLTPSIYSGLLLEVFNYAAGEIEVQSKKNKILSQKLKLFLLPKYRQNEDQTVDNVPTTSSADAKSKSKLLSIRLNSKLDQIYNEIRYKPFSQASSLVKAKAKSIGAELSNLDKMKLEEMEEYVARKLPKITELKAIVMKHLTASEELISMLGRNYKLLQALDQHILNNTLRKDILSEIDEILNTDGQKYNTLRLMCLFHISIGLTWDELSPFINNYCNYFGIKYIHVFHHLAKAGLLPAGELEKKFNTVKILSSLPIPKFQQNEFQANANRLKLLTSSDTDKITPKKSDTDVTCPSYVFNGLYIPLIAQLSSILLKSTSTDDIAQKLGAIEGMNMFCNTSSRIDTTNIKQVAASIKLGQYKDVFPLRKRNLFIFVNGGVTYAEIAACELISRMTDSKIVVASNNIISGSEIIEAGFLNDLELPADLKLPTDLLFQ